MINFNLRLATVLVSGLTFFSACNSGNREQSKSAAVLDTVSLSSKSFALAYQDGNKIVATSIDTMKQISFGGATDPAISPDGNKLAYTVNDSVGQKSIWVADLENKSQLQLHVDSKNYSHAMWSPNGQTIAFNFLDDKNSWKIGVVNADNTGMLALDSKSAVELFAPTWKSGTEVIAHDLKNIYTFSISGKLVKTYTIASWIGPEYHIYSSNSFFYTSDGQKVIFNAGYGSVVKELNNFAVGVFVLDLATKKVIQISPAGMNAPDVFLTADDRIFYSGAEKPYIANKIYVSSLDGEVRTIVDKGTNPTGTLK